MIGSTIADRIVDLEPAGIVVVDNLVRGRLANLESAFARYPVEFVEGDLRDRRARPRPHGRHRRLLPPRRDPHHAVRRGAAPRARGARRRHLQRARGRGRGQGGEGRRVVVGVGLRPRDRVPDRRGPPPLREHHVLRRGEGLQRGHAAQLPRHVRARLRRAALLQRLRRPDGHPRRVHRGARALDGADPRGSASAHPRRRQPDDGLRVRRRHRPGERARGRVRRHRPDLQHRQRCGDEPQRPRPRPPRA